MGKLLLTLTLVAFSSGVLCNVVPNVTDTVNSSLDQMKVNSIYHTLFTPLMQTNETNIPDGNGMARGMILPELLVLKATGAPEVDVNSIVFTLHTREQRTGQKITFNNTVSISRAAWKPDKLTIVTTHGGKESGHLKSCNTIRDAFLEHMDCNVIVVDWSAIANNPSYQIAAQSVPKVADHVAQFLNFMRLSANLNTQQLKMVGFSLGAHVVSLAAGILKESSPVAEVIALDPDKLMFEDKGPDGRVDRSHADYVQVIHTNAGLFGMYRAVGTADFYANEGTMQPGCTDGFTGTCSHERSYMYYCESIGNKKGFPGKSVVGLVMQANMGGSELDSRAKGYMFNFVTRDKEPYATVQLD